LFSGYLSFFELVEKTCPVGGCRNVLGAPACLYGFFMYLTVFILALLGLKAKS